MRGASKKQGEVLGWEKKQEGNGESRVCTRMQDVGYKKGRKVKLVWKEDVEAKQK